MVNDSLHATTIFFSNTVFFFSSLRDVMLQFLFSSAINVNLSIHIYEILHLSWFIIFYNFLYEKNLIKNLGSVKKNWPVLVPADFQLKTFQIEGKYQENINSVDPKVSEFILYLLQNEYFLRCYFYNMKTFYFIKKFKNYSRVWYQKSSKSNLNLQHFYTFLSKALLDHDLLKTYSCFVNKSLKLN